MKSRLAVILLAGLFSGVTWAQQIYKSTEDGTPTFSDTPRGDAEEVDLPPANVMPAPKPIDFELKLKTPEPTAKYRTVEVTSPENDAVVFIRTTNLPIRVNVNPPVRHDLGHRLQITFDGEVLVENQSSYTLDDAHRGTHTITARIVDENGEAIAESEPVAVHIRKPTVLNPNRPG